MPEHPSQEFRSASEHPPLHLVQGSSFFRAWARLVLRYRWLLLATTLAITGYLGVRGYQDLRADTSDEHFLADNAETTRTLHAMRDQFGNDALFQVLVSGEVFSEPYLRRLKKLHVALGALDFELAEPAHAEPTKWDAASDTDDQQFAAFGNSMSDDWGDEAGGSVVDQVISLVNVRRTYSHDDALRVEGLLDSWPTVEQLPALKRRALSDRTLVGQVVDREAQQSVLMVRTRALSPNDRETLHAALVALAERHQAPGFEVMIAGAPAVSATLRSLMLADTQLSLGLSSLVMLVVTFVFFRHPLGMFAPPLVVWQAEVWTLGTMAVTDTPLTMVTTILPAFIGCVGLGDTVHVLSVYRNARSEGMSNDDAIVHSIANTGMPVFLTTLTTAVGLLSFRLASLSAIQEMGTFGALGVCGALVNSIVFLPIVLTFNKKSLLGLRQDGTGQVTMDRVLLWFDSLSAPVRPRVSNRPERDADTRAATATTSDALAATRLPSLAPPAEHSMHHGKRNRVLLISGAAAAISVVGVLNLKVHHDGLEWFPPQNPTRLAINRLEATVGGTANLAIMFEARPGKTLRDRDTLLALEELEQHMLAYDDGMGVGDAVRNTTSLLDPIRETWRAVHGNDEAHYGIPDTERGVQDMFTLFENAGPQELSRLATIDMQRALMTVRVKWRDALAYQPLLEHLEQGLARSIKSVIDARVTGSVHMAVSVVGSLLEDLLRSFGTAALVITIFMVFVLRDVKVGLLAMLPNLLPILLVMGYMGFAGIPLDTATLMLGSVAIGIVVDDTIHYLHQFKVYFDEHGNVDSAVRHAFMHTGRAMVLTSLILVLGFSCVMMSQLQSSRLFGYLVSLTVMAALFCDFTFLPALLRLVYRRDTRA